MAEPILAADETLTPAAPPRSRWSLSPINRRRLDNFKRNRRGYGALWLFLVLFITSLFAELIANDRPIIASYKGEILFPVMVDYPEEKFGGFLARTDYRDPVIANEIKAHGWMIFPPIRFSYDTINRDLPAPAPSPPTWWLSDAQCAAAAAKVGGKGCGDIEWNWLGTDDRGRDVVARLIYGFRISVRADSRACRFAGRHRGGSRAGLLWRLG